jgi:hypothetical protein
MAGATLAGEALEQFGIGQDFVFTVPRWPMRSPTASTFSPRGWEGTALLVAGSAATIEEARVAATNTHGGGAGL